MLLIPRYSQGLFCAVLLGISGQVHAQPPQPNILVIVTDEQHAGMMSCTGNPWVRTPGMDRIAANGTRFEKAYCTNPVCIPSRFSMFTGRLPSVIGMESNNDQNNPVSESILHNAMGNVFRRAGYQTVYAGKVHLPGAIRPDTSHGRIDPYGFDFLAPQDREGRDAAVDACVQFLQKKHNRPFLLVASLINPHDVCYMAVNAFLRHIGEPLPEGEHQQRLATAMQMPDGVSEREFFEKYCPPLPANIEVPEQEPEALVGFKGRRNFRTYTRDKWTEKDWRLHRWAYARLTELVDAQIVRLLDALEKAGLDKNTVVVFVSDHGDNDSAHRLEHKDTYYEESIHVPFIISWNGRTPPGHVDQEHLVSTGLDLIPTLCDFAGIPAPGGLNGRSVRVLAEGRSATDWRDALVIEHANLRILHKGATKYAVYGSGANREQLVDLERDPGEMKNMATLPAYQSQLSSDRQALQDWYAKAGLPLASKYIVTDTPAEEHSSTQAAAP